MSGIHGYCTVNLPQTEGYATASVYHSTPAGTIYGPRKEPPRLLDRLRFTRVDCFCRYRFQRHVLRPRCLASVLADPKSIKLGVLHTKAEAYGRRRQCGRAFPGERLAHAIGGGGLTVVERERRQRLSPSGPRSPRAMLPPFASALMKSLPGSSLSGRVSSVPGWSPGVDGDEAVYP